MDDKVILLNSNEVVDTNPKLLNPDNVQYGELGVNYHKGIETISTKMMKMVLLNLYLIQFMMKLLITFRMKSFMKLTNLLEKQVMFGFIKYHLYL